jgi:opacity protein-like surface antigen
MKMKNRLLLACGFALAIAPAAVAQTPDEPARVFVSVGGGYQSASHGVTNSGSFTLYDEPGTYAGSYSIGKGGFFDVTAGGHVFGQMSVGVTFSRYTKASDVPFNVVVPHPLFYTQPRTLTMNVTNLNEKENWFHFALYYQLLSSSRFDASVSAGPSLVSVKQDSLKKDSGITATETGTPYTAVNLAATFESASKTAFGYNVGFGVNYHVTGAIGAGFFVRYTGASAKLPWGSVKTGGPQFGGAVRYSF